MAGLAGLQPVVHVHHRSRIVHPLNLMRAMAVVAFGGFTVTQPRDLAVVSTEVGFQAFLVAIAAALGDCNPAGSIVWFADAVGRVTVAAHRGISVAGATLALRKTVLTRATTSLGLNGLQM